MTTAAAEPTSTELLSDIASARAEIQKAIAALLDPLDVPGSWTERMKMHDRDRRVRLPQHVALLNNLQEKLSKAIAVRDSLTPQRDRMLAVQATIKQLLEDAPDHNLIVDRRESTHAWAQQNALRASIRAIEQGVESFAGQPALPVPLRELLSDTCASCGHVTVMWSAPLPTLEEKVDKAEQVIASAPASLASIRKSVAPWLTETVSS